MNDDRFNFEDELPDWLQGDDDEPSEPEDSNVEEQPSWTPSEEDSPSDEEIPSSLGVTSMLPWRQEASDPADHPAKRSTIEDMDWQAIDSDDDEPSEPEDDVPDWLSSPTEFDEELEAAPLPQADLEEPPSWLFDSDADEELEPTEAPSPEEEAVPDWISDEDEFEAAEEPILPAASVDEDDELPDWISGEDEFDISEEDFEAAITSAAEHDDLEDMFDELSGEKPSTGSGIHRITPAEEVPDKPRIRKLGSRSEADSEEELTFEEWEQLQEQKEFEEEHAEELALQQEVPDWFRDNVEVGDATSEVASILIPDMEEAEPEEEPEPPPAEEVKSDYVPEWFMGLDELDDEAEPDWMKEASSSDISSLTDVSAFAPPEPEEEPEPPPTLPMDADVPDWFKGIGDEETVSDDWMADLPSTETEDLGTPPGFEEDVPELDFAEELTADESSADVADMASELEDLLGEPTLVETTPSEGEEPDWLRDYEPAAEQQADDLLQLEDEAAPSMDWLEDVDDELEFSEQSAAPPDQPTEAAVSFDSSIDDLLDAPTDIDDLLGGLFETTPEPSEMMSAGQDEMLFQESEATSLFDGVDDSLMEALDKAEAQPKQPEPPAPEPRPRAPQPAPTMPVAPTPPPVIEEPPEEEPLLMEADSPEWIEQFRPEIQVTLRAGGLELEFEQQNLSNLDEDVRHLREQSQQVLQTHPPEAAEPIESGTLAGVAGGLNIPSVVQRGPVEMTTGIHIPRDQFNRVELLRRTLDIAAEEEYVDEEDEEEPRKAPRRRRRRRRRRRHVDRLFISLILLAALIGPFATDVLHFANDPEDTYTIKQEVVFAAIDLLNPGDRVLLAFEYGPTAAGELNGLSEAILRDILYQRAIPITLSTNPMGALNARGVLNELATDEWLLDAMERDKALEAGEDYYTLRYVAGGPVAIRGLARSSTLGTLVFSTDSSGEKTGLEIDRVEAEDFALAIVIAETAEDVRDWAEQFDVPELPKLFLVTAAAEPIARTYVATDPEDNQDLRSFVGYLAGYRDTYRYNQRRNQFLIEPFEAPDDLDIPDPTVSQWHSMALGILAAGLIIIVGMVVNTLRGLRRRRR